LAGTLVTIAVVLTLAVLGSLDGAAVHALAIKSVTAAVAVELAKLHGADPGPTAAGAVTTGALGAMLGPLILSWSRITDPVARGIALGTISHGQGTSVALVESEVSGAMASLATAATAVVTSLLASTYVPLLLQLLGG
jgi:putative effector of murein hydrolase